MKISACTFVYGIFGLLQWLVVWQNTITKESCITIEGNCDIMHGVISLPDAMSYDKDWKHGNFCYELVNRKVSWSGAVKLCAQMNNYLVEVDHQPEQDVGLIPSKSVFRVSEKSDTTQTSLLS